MVAQAGRKKRGNNESANNIYQPGVHGRKTGITLPQGARDEHGIEDLDGIFSSPEKPAPQRSAQNGSKTLTSEDMQLAHSMSGVRVDSGMEADGDTEGSAPEPTEVLSTRRLTLKSSKTTFPPALGRSPYKTNIGSSPRRQSSAKPRRLASDTPELLQPRPTVTRRLDFTRNGDVTSTDERPLRQPAKRKSGVAPKKDIYTIEATEDEDEGRYTEEPELPLPDESLQLLQDDGYDELPPMDEPSEIHQISSPSRRKSVRSSGRFTNTTALDPEEEEELPVEPSPKKKGKAPARRSLQGIAAAQSKAAVARRGGKAPLRSTKQRQQAAEDSAISMDESTLEPSFVEPPRRTTARGKLQTRSAQLPTPDYTQPTPDDPIETTELDDSVVEPPPKKRGKPGPKRKIPVHSETELDISAIPDPEEATELERPAKRAKAAPKKAAAKKAAPKERDPNIQFKKPNLPPVKPGTGSRWDESMWANSRNMSRLRDPTPSAEALVGRTRSGRQVIKPLNHFANERAQYGRDGTLLAVQTAETVEREVKRSSSRAPSRAPARSVSRARPRIEETIVEEDEDEEDADLEDWEARGEMIHGEVNDYDPLTGAATGDYFETELAWGPNSIPLMPVHSANFGFAKLLSMPYFGSGIMDFPVGGFKKPRNSGKTSLHVFVHTGKVFVRIGGGSSGVAASEFMVSKGGSFHVPRGNLYEIENVAGKPARLFFAQGTEMVVS